MVITIGSKIFDGDHNEYILDNVINSGGFGTVYKARRESDNKVFAVKTLRNDFSDSESLLSFQKELQQTLLVDSDHVIKYYYVNDGNDQKEYPPFIIMEYADGGTLADLIELHRKSSEQFSTDDIYSILYQLAEGMRDVNKKVTHRDIKPQNILISNGVLKITDFGLSKLVNDSTKSRTFKGWGTSRYIAPEAWKMDKNTMQMDVYSMGVVFYEVATLGYPYKLSEKPTEEEIKDAHCFSPVNNPQRINAAIPPELSAIIIKMLAKATRDRYTDWESILDGLGKRNDAKSDFDLLVNKALERQNATDLAVIAAENERKRKYEEKQQRIKLMESQFNNLVIEPLRDFAEAFNAKYPNGNPLLVTRRGVDISEKFSFEFDIRKKKIVFQCEVIFSNNFERTVSDFFGGSHTINYIPQVNNKDVMLWCYVYDEKDQGFNLLLLKEEKDSEYGRMYVMENRSTGFVNPEYWREGTFGFSLEDLPEGVDDIHCFSMYDSEIKEFSSSYVINYITERM